MWPFSIILATARRHLLRTNILQTIFLSSLVFGPAAYLCHFLWTLVKKQDRPTHQTRPAKPPIVGAADFFFFLLIGIVRSFVERLEKVAAPLFALFFSAASVSWCAIGRSQEITERRKLLNLFFGRALQAAATGKRSRSQTQTESWSPRRYSVPLFFGARHDGPQKTKGKKNHRRQFAAPETGRWLPVPRLSLVGLACARSFFFGAPSKGIGARLGAFGRWEQSTRRRCDRARAAKGRVRRRRRGPFFVNSINGPKEKRKTGVPETISIFYFSIFYRFFF